MPSPGPLASWVSVDTWPSTFEDEAIVFEIWRKLDLGCIFGYSGVFDKRWAGCEKYVGSWLELISIIAAAA